MRNSKWGLKDLNLATIAQVLIIIANIILSIINWRIAGNIWWPDARHEASSTFVDTFYLGSANH